MTSLDWWKIKTNRSKKINQKSVRYLVEVKHSSVTQRITTKYVDMTPVSCQFLIGFVIWLLCRWYFRQSWRRRDTWAWPEHSGVLIRAEEHRRCGAVGASVQELQLAARHVPGPSGYSGGSGKTCSDLGGVFNGCPCNPVYLSSNSSRGKYQDRGGCIHFHSLSRYGDWRNICTSDCKVCCSFKTCI